MFGNRIRNEQQCFIEQFGKCTKPTEDGEEVDAEAQVLVQMQSCAAY